MILEGLNLLLLPNGCLATLVILGQPTQCLGKNTSLDYMLGAAVNLHQGLPPSAWNKKISNSRDFEIEI